MNENMIQENEEITEVSENEVEENTAIAIHDDADFSTYETDEPVKKTASDYALLGLGLTAGAAALYGLYRGGKELHRCYRLEHPKKEKDTKKPILKWFANRKKNVDVEISDGSESACDADNEDAVTDDIYDDVEVIDEE